MIRPLVLPIFLTTSLVGLSLSLTICCQDSLALKLWGKKHQSPPVITYPKTPMPPQGKLIPPPQENAYFPMRTDGQPFSLDIDTTVNQTETLNRFYYDPAWRGEVWQPYDSYMVVEKGVRHMNTWAQYNAATQSRKLTGIHQWFEKWSGFGP